MEGYEIGSKVWVDRAFVDNYNKKYGRGTKEDPRLKNYQGVITGALSTTEELINVEFNGLQRSIMVPKKFVHPMK